MGTKITSTISNTTTSPTFSLATSAEPPRSTLTTQPHCTSPLAATLHSAVSAAALSRVIAARVAALPLELHGELQLAAGWNYPEEQVHYGGLRLLQRPGAMLTWGLCEDPLLHAALVLDNCG